MSLNRFFARRFLIVFGLISVLFSGFSGAARAAGELTSAPAISSKELQDLLDRVSKLEARVLKQDSESSPETEELQKLKLQLALPESLGSRFLGYGPGLSKAYFSRSPLSFGAYGDLNFLNTDTGTRTTNLARVNPLIGYRFSKSLVANVGFSFPSGGVVDSSGTSSVAFAAVDFFTNETSGLRFGNVLVPVGISNVRPEPELYPTVQRPSVETLIIPAPWHENGLLYFNQAGPMSYQAGLINGDNAAGDRGASWIAGGRQNGFNASMQNLAWVARAEWVQGEQSVGVSGYYGDSNQGDNRLGNSQVWLGEIHSELELGRFSSRLLYTEGHLTNTDRIYQLSQQVVGKTARGAEVVLSFELLPNIAPIAHELSASPTPPGWRRFPVFVSWESVNPQADTDAPSALDDTLHFQVFTAGFNFRPHPQLIVKADYANRVDGAGTISRTYEAGLGFVF